VTATEFASSLEGWHDFYLAVAGASAALLGLLFVGISINLASITADERKDLRALAEQAFANLLYVLVIALVMLVPEPKSDSIGISLAVIGGVGILRTVRSFRVVPRLAAGRLTAVRRLSWTFVADVLIGYVAVNFLLWADADAAGLLMIAIFVLLVGAADISWSMLVEVTTEGPTGS
jgi:modulator of FtsH protease